MVENTQNGAAQATDVEKISDKVLMYACVFTYEKPKVRKDVNRYDFKTSGKIALILVEEI